MTTTVPAEVRLNDGLGAWVPMHERPPAPGTECLVLVRYTMDRPPFCTVDKWEEQREDPTGMGGPTIATGYGWNDNYESDVIAWIAIPPHPPAEWDQRLPDAQPTALEGCGFPDCGGDSPECIGCSQQ